MTTEGVLVFNIDGFDTGTVALVDSAVVGEAELVAGLGADVGGDVGGDVAEVDVDAALSPRPAAVEEVLAHDATPIRLLTATATTPIRRALAFHPKVMSRPHSCRMRTRVVAPLDLALAVTSH